MTTPSDRSIAAAIRMPRDGATWEGLTRLRGCRTEGEQRSLHRALRRLLHRGFIRRVGNGDRYVGAEPSK